ncbi:hypothetical protein AMAG_18103 [Allomyces macrogynus ATCC 38327]|uniref:Uncharacterized protein n=1 Tax=Allomyces macrogynus (strain ATCC 38327) TaxID=578462 RepID=A0A0L0S9K8_ALLM3|nr:hypothetical protein AMAG_18103 [Allomyces macrogynus ATCC 38327]|eukprot:KNE59131.1 hypothetical protein AMAG_18103 [Allomyces macrogynus ATCC 38327]
MGKPKSGRSRSSSPAKPAATAAKAMDVLAYFEQALASSPDMTPPIAAIKTLVELVRQSSGIFPSELSDQPTIWSLIYTPTQIR